MKLTRMGSTILALAVWFAASPLHAAPPPDWAIELTPAFDAYYAGDMRQAQRRVTQVLGDFRSPTIQRQARAFEAMLLMRSDLRGDRQEGRSRFAKIAADDPAMADNPEFLLAVGFAHRGLDESSASVAAMHTALDGFLLQGRNERACVAAVELARSWAGFTEWEFGVPGLVAPRVEGRQRRDEIRLEQIAIARARIASLPGASGALADLDLIAIGIELQIGTRAEAAEKRLTALAAGDPAEPANADAAIMLAGRFMADSGWSAASDLLERVKNGADRARADRAAKMLSEIVAPLIELSVADTVAPGDDTVVTLRARNVRAVTVEVRRLNLADWLMREKGRVRAQTIPLEGSVAEVREVVTSMERAHDWFVAPADALRFNLPRGAYVLVARSGKDDSVAVSDQRMLVVGDLDLRVVTGDSRVLFALTRDGAALPAETRAQVTFWVEGYETPQVVELHSGIAVAELPTLFRILKSAPWRALAQLGDDVALCGGSVASGAIEPTPPASVLSIGAPPSGPEASEFTIAGVVLWSGAIVPPNRVLSLTYELVDLSDRVVATLSGNADLNGAFRVRFNIPTGTAGQTLRFQVRAGGRVLAVQSRPTQFTVQKSDAPQMLARLDGPEWAPEMKPVASVGLHVETPWGAPITSASARVRAYCVRLPSATLPQPIAESALAQTVTMNSDGALQAHIAMQNFGSDLDEPIAMRLSGRAFGWDGRDVDVEQSTLFDRQRCAVWTTVAPPQPVAGESVRFSSNWFDPSGQMGGARPKLTIRRDGAVVKQFMSGPVSNEFWSDVWAFPLAGEYSLETSVTTDRETVVDERKITVSASERRDFYLIESIDAVLNSASSKVEITIRGTSKRPLVVAVLLGEPVAASIIGPFSGSTACEISLPARTARGAYELIVADPVDPLFAISARTRVRADGEHAMIADGASADPAAIALDVSPPARGTRNLNVGVKTTGTCAATGTLWLRVLPARDTGTVEWTPSEVATSSAGEVAQLELASSRTHDIGRDARWIANSAIDPDALASLQRGPSAALDQVEWHAPADGQFARMALPIPEMPGDYRVCAVLRASDGRWMSTERRVTVERPVRIDAFPPRSLIVGDRVFVPIRIWNDSERAVDGTLTIAISNGLAVESILPVGSDAKSLANRKSPHVEIGPRSEATLNLLCEASRPGRGSLDVELRAESGAEPLVVRGQASFRVYERAESATDPAVTISRSYYRVVASLEDDPSTKQHKPIRFDRREQIPLAAGDVIPAGALVLVEEVLSVHRPLSDLEWTQRAPSNCITFGIIDSNLKLLAPHEDIRLDSVRGHRDSLPVGSYTHQFVWTAQRSGSARLPFPELRADRQTVPIALTPADSVLTVDR